MPGGTNIGEWSEFYVFLKVLSDRKLISADPDLNPLSGQDSPVIRVFRNEDDLGEKSYELPSNNDTQIIFTEKGSKPLVLDSKKISSKLKTIFNKILEGKSEIKDGSALMKYLHCSRRNATHAGSKEDLEMVIHNPRTGMEPRIAYSIKSQVGSPSTLLNASGATNFIYEITGLSKNTRSVNSKGPARDRVRSILQSGGDIRFSGIQNGTFGANLQLIDTIFPEIMATLLFKHYSDGAYSLADVLNSMEESVSLPSGKILKKQVIEIILKRFLVAVALGLTPSKPWDGRQAATGRYPIFKSNGDLVCYHIFNLTSFEDYLLKSTKFERGSESRHGYGEVYEESGRRFIKLNLQIRFIR